MAFFEGLIVTEDGAPVSVAHIGAESFYVIDDQGFRRHIDAAEVDRPVMAQFLAQLQEHKDEAGQAMLKMIGQDDLFTKAMVDSTLDNITLDQMIGQTLAAGRAAMAEHAGLSRRHQPARRSGARGHAGRDGGVGRGVSRPEE